MTRYRLAVYLDGAWPCSWKPYYTGGADWRALLWFGVTFELLWW